MFTLEGIINFMRKGSYVILSFVIARIVDTLYGEWAGEIVFFLITGVISGIKYLKKREAKALMDTYLTEKEFKDYKLLNIEQKENGLWKAECMISDYEKYYDDLHFDIELDTWSGRYSDNFTEKEQEHFLEYSDREKHQEVVSVIQEEAADIQEEVFEAI